MKYEIINLAQRIVDRTFWKIEEIKERKLIWSYKRAAAHVGILSTYTGLIGSKDLEDAIGRWRKLEQTYADAGFRPIDNKVLSKKGYYGISIDDLVGQRLEEGENPILYAPAYQEAIERRKNRPKLIVSQTSEGDKERSLIRDYTAAAKHIGELSTLTCYGLPVGLEKDVEKWRELEQKYADRGFRPIDKKILSERGYNCKSIGDLVGQRLEEGENPILYAPAYQEAIERRKNRPEGWGGVLSMYNPDDFVVLGEGEFEKLVADAGKNKMKGGKK